ncbi:MAG: hypothetical protein A2X12_01850 [Bacteroidetes bacterium GWE2_29_8]|nr:MAG: hypothetical protein A2X12_01850 [Bacteroidetes bacterium GWE2_29_8]OFY23967.1 MAG: hypothetical protein A2X02_00960 [Bacteroidetes bacterium GWF2_29_10]
MSNKVVLDYHGLIDFGTIQVLLRRVKDIFSIIDVDKSVKKKVFNIMVECLENILKHSNEVSFYDYDFDIVYPKISIIENGNKFIITTQNSLQNINKEKLTNSIDALNKLDKEQLKKYYENRIFNTQISEKGGAGLGLIDIVLKSENNIEYNIEQIDEKISLFKQTIIILKKK